MRYSPEHRPRTRERILKLAARVVAAQGPQQVGVISVMKAAGLTQGGFYLHFESRDALIEAAIEYVLKRVIRRWERETKGRTPEDALTAYIDFYLSPGHRKSLFRRCPIPAIASDLPRLSMTAREVYAAGTDAIVMSLAGQLELLRFPNAVVLARSVLSELAGAIALSRSEEREGIADEILESSRLALRQRLGLATVHRISEATPVLSQ